jgi:hypothetical protein
VLGNVKRQGVGVVHDPTPDLDAPLDSYLLRREV